MKTIYLDNAATSRFKPLSVYAETMKTLYRSANAGRGSHSASLKAASLVENTRDIIRSHFFDGDVIFTKNCTEALNLAILGLPLSGTVLTSVLEHNSVLRPVHKLASDGKIKYLALSPEGIVNSVSANTKLVVITAMSNVTGQATDVSTIAKGIKEKSNALVLVDMAQAAGHLKIDYSNIDMIACAGHKGLHGEQGTGFLLSKNSDTLSPLIFGGTGSASMNLDTPNSLDALEAGTLNTPGIAALGAGIQWTFNNFNRINGKIKKLSDMLISGLSTIRGLTIYPSYNGIVLCNFGKRECTDAADVLNAEFGICARAGLHCAPLAHKHLGTAPMGAIRFSVGFNNNAQDIAQTIDAMHIMSK